MKQLLLLALATLVMAVPASAQSWQFANVFPPDTLETDGNGMHGIAVDPDGKVWMQPFGATDSVEVAALGGFQPVRVVYVFNADGTPASFSPLKYIEYADGVTPRDTLGGYLRRNDTNDLVWEGRSGRGLRRDADGNILISQFVTLYKIDYQTGEGLARVDVDDYCGLTQAGTDNSGNVYVAPVCPGPPIRIYDTDLNLLGNVTDVSSNFSRSITAAPDGLTVYETDFENTYTIIHQRPSIFASFDSVGVAFRGMRTESAAIHPVTGNLWVSSGNPLNLPNQDATVATSWLSNTWYEFSPDDLETPLDSIRWAGLHDVRRYGGLPRHARPAARSLVHHGRQRRLRGRLQRGRHQPRQQRREVHQHGRRRGADGHERAGAGLAHSELSEPVPRLDADRLRTRRGRARRPPRL